MLRRCLFAAALLAVTGGHSIAETQPFAFTGSIVVTARQGADCDSVNVQVGELHTSGYRPVQTGVAKAALQMLQAQVAVRIEPAANGNFAASGQYSAKMFSGRVGYKEFTGTYSALVITPSPQKATTKVIDISGKISNFKNGGDCTITFAGGYVLKPANSPQ
jgi:hypothetical protein